MSSVSKPFRHPRHPCHSENDLRTTTPSVMILEVRWPTWPDFCLAKTGTPTSGTFPALMDPVSHRLDMDLQLIINNLTSQTISFPSFQTLATSVHCNISVAKDPGLIMLPLHLHMLLIHSKGSKHNTIPTANSITNKHQVPMSLLSLHQFLLAIAQIGKYGLAVCVLPSCKHPCY